ncbi:hypothetical protein ABW19_dt0208250 [Dactylella cylindrospora]|nr:hypothetical protein ABW19_dt0208250 [Dactylella cylindrospora]
MALPDTTTEIGLETKAAENDDVGDNFARSPSDAFNSVSDHGRGLRSQELGSMRSASRFAGSSSGVYFLRTVCDAIAKAGTSENLTSAPAVNLRFIPGEDERGGDTNGFLWHASEVASAGDTIWPSFEDLVGLISDTYIRGWHPLTPFLPAETILPTLEEICSKKKIDIRTPESVSIRSVISISLLDRRQMAPKEGIAPLPSCLVFKSLEDCNSSIHPLLRDNTLISLQGMLSAQIFMISIMELRSASRLGGWIIRMAFDLGLHRCPCRYRLSFGENEIAIRRRIFWTIYNLDRYLCQALGLPLGVRDEDVDVCLPNNELHKLPDDKVQESSAEDMRLVPLILLSKYSGIKGRLMEISNKCLIHRTSDASHALRDVHVDILKWHNEVEDATHSSGDDEDSDTSEPGQNPGTSEYRAKTMSPAHRLLFQIKYHELLLLMHRPALSAKSTNETYPVAMLTCLSSARSIINLTKRYLSRHKISGGRVEFPLLWHILLSTIWMSGLVVIFAAFERGVALDSANRDIQSVWPILQHLALRLPGKPKACEVALRALYQLMCRKRGFASVESKSSMGRQSKRQKRTAPEVSASVDLPAASGLPHASTASPPESLIHSQGITMPSDSSPVANSDLLPPTSQRDMGQAIAPSPSQGSLDENQVLWLLDVPGLLDDQSLNFFSGQSPSVDMQATSEFNADTLFNSLRMNMGNEDASLFFDDTGGAPFI